VAIAQEAPSSEPLVPIRDRAGRRRRFDDIYRTWFEDVARWLRALGAPAADLDDLVQDVFLVVWRRLPEFDGKNVAGWLYRIARRRVRDFRRLGWVQRRDADSAGTLAAARTVDSVPFRERWEAVDLLLGCLNETERSALLLYELGGYSGREITHIQGAPLNTVWARLASARRKLKARSAWTPPHHNRALTQFSAVNG
jgi:RNA polymerase sigma-70 factor (ECF subfamily)